MQALAVSDTDSIAILLLVLGAMVACSVLFSRAANRLGIPLVLLFLGLGMLGGSEGIGGVAFENYHFAARVGTAALVLILFDGGMNTSAAAIRSAIFPATTLATLGVVITAGVVAVFARWMGLPWPQAMVLGAVVSPTDAAVVFSVLRGGGLSLKPKVGHVLEVESCVNDPMSVILTTGLIELARAKHASGWMLALEVPLEMGIGAGMGFAFGFIGRFLLRRIRLPTVGLYPALTLSLALCAFGGTTLCHGSGFLAVYVAAATVGNAARVPYRSGLIRIHDALAWLSQIAMFLMLGLLVFPSHLPAVAGKGLALGLVLALIARPLAAMASLLPFRFSAKEASYVSWVGLRGAVPIILATFPVMGNVAGAERIFDLVFFIVVVNSFVPGTLVRVVTKWLQMDAPGRPAPVAALEINSPNPLAGELVSFFIEPSLAVCGAKLSELPLPKEAGVMLVVRGQSLIAGRGGTTLEVGDHVYVFFQPADRGLIELLFGGPQETG